MDKLEYDSLHKFFVSLGTILVTLPIIAFLYLLNSDLILISQNEYDNLSYYSQQAINQKEQITKFISIALPIASGFMFVTGIIFIVIGIINWKKVQKNLDALVEAEKISKELDNARQKNTEIVAKANKSVEERPNEKIDSSDKEKSIMKYMEIEDRFFTYGIPNPIKRRYYFKRNLRIGKFLYDGVAVSKSDNMDLIYEIKYWPNTPTRKLLENTFENLYRSGENYENTNARNFKCVLAIVTTNDKIEQIRTMVRRMLINGNNYYLSMIRIKYIDEETLK